MKLNLSMKVKRGVKSIILGFFIFWTEKALAVCPVCTIGAGAGVGLCRFLKIDDTITGIWIGGLIASFFFWTLAWLETKKINFALKNFFVALVWYLPLIISLKWMGFIGDPRNMFGGVIDKLILGIIVGSLGFYFGVYLHNFLKNRNQNKSYFPYQKVAIPLSILIILTLVFYFLLKNW